MSFIDNIDINPNTPRFVRGPFIIINSVVMFLSTILLCLSGLSIYFLNDYYLLKEMTLPIGSFVLTAYMVIVSIVGIVAIWKKKVKFHMGYMVLLFLLVIALVGVSSKMVYLTRDSNKLEHKIEKVWSHIGNYHHGRSLHYLGGLIEKIEKSHQCCGWSKETEGGHCRHFTKRNAKHGYCGPLIERNVEALFLTLGIYGIVLSIIEIGLLILSTFVLIKVNNNPKSKSFILQDE
ncbi:hypothetical protein DICPUDRAFT_38928 [Dictyostelium purpureum]|uniref:Tetraspanin n=1 Tax=Dictyostelium purpureum TaxID=5786 RepID=F0ZVF9_DICPU|nr:uncharacterized protein DICPUDRAFT_38928 [Dictyostelium purpureum]EGC32081.1 hypothetical protein DICPUDRAFT_38928 [Dictyostelium purpureum]|eukprot:XP_003291404.1 hypothetical protein DICPUDRAFT_38928 [Dictyostelium purpureum]